MKKEKPIRCDKIVYLVLTVFILCLTFLSMNCKKQPTAPEINSSPNDNSVLISCSPSSGGTGTIINLEIMVIGNSKEITSFGLEMTFDPAVFKYQSSEKSDLTASWATVDGNKINPGHLVIGGFMGSGNPVPTGSGGNLAIVKINVIYEGNEDGFARQISVKNYTDDIGGMNPEPSYATFTFRK